jgi:hypothetical protein
MYNYTILAKVWSGGERFDWVDHLRIGKKVIFACEVAWTLVTRCLSIISVLPGFHSDYKVTTERMAQRQI